MSQPMQIVLAHMHTPNVTLPWQKTKQTPPSGNVTQSEI